MRKLIAERENTKKQYGAGQVVWVRSPGGGRAIARDFCPAGGRVTWGRTIGSASTTIACSSADTGDSCLTTTTNQHYMHDGLECITHTGHATRGLSLPYGTPMWGAAKCPELCHICAGLSYQSSKQGSYNKSKTLLIRSLEAGSVVEGGDVVSVGDREAIKTLLWFSCKYNCIILQAGRLSFCLCNHTMLVLCTWQCSRLFALLKLATLWIPVRPHNLVQNH